MIQTTKTKTAILFTMAAILFLVSCTKKTEDLEVIAGTGKTVRFVLYTEQDFSQEQKNITFSVFIRKAGDSRHLFDSTFSVMKVKDIPSPANKIVFEKTVPAGLEEALEAGFVYYLENVGYSWKIDRFDGGNWFQELNYSFR